MHHKVLINGRILQNKVYDSVVVRSNRVTKKEKEKRGAGRDIRGNLGSSPAPRHDQVYLNHS